MRADGHGLPHEMQLHAALLQQKLAVQHEIERAAREEDELQRAIEEADGLNSSGATTNGANDNGDGDNYASTGRNGGDGDGIKDRPGRSSDGSGEGQSGSGDEERDGGGAGGAPTPRRSSVGTWGGGGREREEGVPGKSSVQTRSDGFDSTRQVDGLHMRLRTWPFWLENLAVKLKTMKLAFAVDKFTAILPVVLQ